VDILRIFAQLWQVQRNIFSFFTSGPHVNLSHTAFSRPTLPVCPIQQLSLIYSNSTILSLSVSKFVTFKSKWNKICRLPNTQIWTAVIKLAGPIVRTIYGAGLWPFACWDSGFESRWRHGCLSLVSGMCCRVYFSATGWSLVQRSPTECGVSECDLKTSTMRRPMPNMAVEPLGGEGGYLWWLLLLFTLGSSPYGPDAPRRKGK
jgi:hypothetical protein